MERIYNCQKSKDLDDDWTFDDAVKAELFKDFNNISNEVDWRKGRERWWKIDDQKYTGSCVGWAVADSMLRLQFVESKRLKKSQRLSVRYLWMAAKEFDEDSKRPTTFIENEGTSIKTALRVAQKYGVVTTDFLPLNRNKVFAGNIHDFYNDASQRRINAFYNLRQSTSDATTFSEGDIQNWEKWLSWVGPIVVRLNIDDTWTQQEISKDGSLDQYSSISASPKKAHAVALVGYEKERFIIRNSHGIGWGKLGYAFATYEYAHAAFTEAYGAIVYPTDNIYSHIPKRRF